jgi:hypothetical protein
MLNRRILLALLAVLPGAAFAHHGWSWAEADESVLEGTIAAISLSPPHPELTVEDADGTVWNVELGNPTRTERAGFVEGTAAPGDTVTVLGNRSLDPEEKLMKAVRITLKGVNHDFYPERIDA